MQTNKNYKKLSSLCTFFLVSIFFTLNFTYAENVVLLKTSNGILAGKVTYKSNTFADKLKLQSFCFLKKVSEGLNCEFLEENEKSTEAVPTPPPSGGNNSGGTVVNNITNVTNIISPLTTVFLKTSNGALVGKLSYESSFTNDVKVNSFCAYKLISEGVTCEFIDPQNPLSANPDLAIRNVAPGELDTSSIWSAIGGVSNRLNNFIKTVATVNPEVRQNLQDPVVVNTPIANTPVPPTNTPVTNIITVPGQSASPQIVYQVIERAVPGPQGPAGPQGPQGPAGSGYSQPIVSFPGTAQFNGYVASTQGGDITATNGNFTTVNVTGTASLGSISGAGLASCNATTSKLVYNSTTKLFECSTDQDSFGSVSSISLQTLNASTTNSSTTNSNLANLLTASTSYLTSSNATITNSTSTNIFTTNLTTSSSTIGSSTASNITSTGNIAGANLTISGSSTLGSTTLTNLTVTGDIAANDLNLNGTATFATTTSASSSITSANIQSLWSNILSAITATITTLWGTTGNFLTLNASTTNATTTNADTANLLTASTSFLTSSNATFTNSTSTNIFGSQITGTTGTFTNLNNTNATLTNASVTTLYAANLQTGLSNGYVFRGSGSNLSEATSSLFISNAGLVGIGNTSPNANLRISQGTLTGSAQGALVIDGTWNNAGTIFKGIELDVTNTSSHSNSNLFNLALGGSSVFKVNSQGNTIMTGTLGVTGTTTINAPIDVSSNKILNVAYPTNTTDAANKAYVDGLVAGGVAWQAPVITISTTSIVASTTGDRYIVDTGSSGTGCAIKSIAQNIGSGSWTCTTPATGTTVFVNSGIDTTYNFNGSNWVSLGSTVNHANLIGLQGGTAGEYYHVNQSQYNNLNSVNAQLSQLLTTGTATQFVNLTLTGGLNISGGSAGATITNATFTNTTVLNNASATNIIGSFSTITNSTSTNFFATLLSAVTAIITNLTATNLEAQNATTTNATSTSAYISSLLSAATANITTLFATTGTITNLNNTNATLTNATSSNLYVSGTFTTASPASFSATSTFSTTTAASSTINTLNSNTINSVNISNTGSSTLGSTTISNLSVTGYIAANLANLVTAYITTLWGTTGNFFTLNASTTNATTTNTSGLTTTGQLHVTGSTTLASSTLGNTTFTGTTNFTSLPNIPLTNGYILRGSSSGLQEATSSLFIANNGNVGIGVTAPSGKLEIGGAEAADEARLIFAASDASNRFTIETDLDGTPANDILGFRSTDVDNILVLKGNGNVGIGTTSPSSLLSVAGNAAVNHLIPNGAYTNNLSAYDLGATGQRWNALWAGTLNIGTSTHSIKQNSSNGLGIYTAASGGGTEAMTISSGGNVGIGTTAPASKLTVTNNSTTLPIAPAATVMHLANSDANSTRLLIDTFAGNGAVTFRKSNGTAAAPLAVLSTNVLGSLTGDGYGTTAYGGGARVSINLIGTENWTDSANGTGITFFTSTNGTTVQTERLRIDHNGNIGIGTTTPSALLSIGNTNGIMFTTATTSFSSTGGINLTAGCFAINGVCVGSGGGGGVSALGILNSQSKAAAGAVISGSTLYMQTADTSFDGLLSTTTQSIAGVKTFTGGIISTASSTFTGTTTISGAFMPTGSFSMGGVGFHNTINFYGTYAATTSVVFIGTTGVQYRGLSGGYAGRMLIIRSIGSSGGGSFTIFFEDPGATSAADRIYNGGTYAAVTYSQNEAVFLTYSNTLSRWVIVNHYSPVAIQAGGGGGDGGSDLAEYHVSTHEIEKGTIVSVSDSPYSDEYPVIDLNTGATTTETYSMRMNKVTTASPEYRHRLLGVVTTRPGHVLGKEDITKISSTTAVVALTGHVPVKVNLDGGPIHIGDPITISTSTEGVGMKATKSGKIIGYALDNYTSIDQNPENMIEVQVVLGEHVSEEGVAFLDGMVSLGGKIVEDVIHFVKLSVDEIVAKVVKTELLCVGQYCVNEQQFGELLNGNNITPTSSPDTNWTSGGNGTSTNATSSNATSSTAGSPVVTLNGEASMSINIGDSFTDPLATITDDQDTGLTLVIAGSVNTSVAGVYTIEYASTPDTQGNTSNTVTRTVTVTEPAVVPEAPPEAPTEENVPPETPPV